MSMSTASNWLWNVSPALVFDSFRICDLRADPLPLGLRVSQFGIGYATPYLVNPTSYGVNGTKTANLGVKVFFLWGATCTLCVIFTYFLGESTPLLSYSLFGAVADSYPPIFPFRSPVPETKGLSLEQVDLLYRESSIIKSNAYRKSMLERDETFIHRDGALPEEKAAESKHVEHTGHKEQV